MNATDEGKSRTIRTGRLAFFFFCAVFYTVVCVAFTGRTFAGAPEEAAVRSALTSKVTELLTLVGNGQIDGLIQRIGSPADANSEAHQNLRTLLAGVYGDAGKYSGYDFIGYKILTARYRVTYVLAYFDRKPVLFEFGFYQIDGDWRPQHLHCTTDVRPLLDTLPMQR